MTEFFKLNFACFDFLSKQTIFAYVLYIREIKKNRGRKNDETTHRISDVTASTNVPVNIRTVICVADDVRSYLFCPILSRRRESPVMPFAVLRRRPKKKKSGSLFAG